MTKPAQKEIEKYYFERFKNSYDKLPSGKVIYSNNPDVIIHGDRKTGIEITNFYLEDGNAPESEQRQRVIRDEIINNAQIGYLNENRKRIELSFGFDKSKAINDRNSIVREIVKLARHLENYRSGEVYKNVYSNIEELDFVYVNSKEYDDVKWRVIQVYDVPLMSIEKLLEIIKTKEISAMEYQPCDNLWLLIVVDYFDHAQDQEIRIDGLNDIKSKIYEKVIVYKTIFEHIIILKNG